LNTVRAAFHVHSEWSYDARLTLDQIAELFRGRCDAVFMCEHDRGFSASRLDQYREACAQASAAGPVLVPGIEYAGPGDRVHVPVWGPVPFLGEELATGSLLSAVAAAGGFSVLAHPVRRDAWQSFEPEWLELAGGVEIWTRKWDGWAPNRRALEWASRHGLAEVVALDLHREHQLFPLAMELEIEGPLSAEACVGAALAGRARPMLGTVPVSRLCGGAAGSLAQATERLRRPVFRRGRELRDRLRPNR
jgi:hypothetical protein